MDAVDISDTIRIALHFEAFPPQGLATEVGCMVMRQHHLWTEATAHTQRVRTEVLAPLEKRDGKFSTRDR